MTRDEFQRAIVLFAEAFPKTEFNPKLWWPMVSDLDGEAFCFAVQEFIKTTKELYPGSNPLAILIEKHDDLIFQRRSMQRKKIEKETDAQRRERWRRESCPPPKEWREMMVKIKRVPDET